MESILIYPKSWADTHLSVCLEYAWPQSPRHNHVIGWCQWKLDTVDEEKCRYSRGTAELKRRLTGERSPDPTTEQECSLGSDESGLRLKTRSLTLLFFLSLYLGSRVLNLEKSTSIEMYGSCSLESPWRLIVALRMNSNRTPNRQQTLSFHQDVDGVEGQLKVFAQYPSLNVSIHRMEYIKSEPEEWPSSIVLNQVY